jgi:hypothetical protein
MHDDQEPDTSYGPPPAVMRTALGLCFPFAVLWMVGGAIGRYAVLTGPGATWPSVWHSGGVAALVLLASAICGCVCAVGSRLLLWYFVEQMRKRSGVRPPRVREDIRTAQDWRSEDVMP